MKKNTQVIEQKVDEEILIIPIIDGVAQMKRVCCLSKSGTVIWDLIPSNDEIDESAIISCVAQHYAVGEEKIKDDVTEFIEKLKEQKLLI